MGVAVGYAEVGRVFRQRGACSCLCLIDVLYTSTVTPSVRARFLHKVPRETRERTQKYTPIDRPDRAGYTYGALRSESVTPSSSRRSLTVTPRSTTHNTTPRGGHGVHGPNTLLTLSNIRTHTSHTKASNEQWYIFPASHRAKEHARGAQPMSTLRKACSVEWPMPCCPPVSPSALPRHMTPIR